MPSKKITLRTGNLKEATKEFVEAWHKVERGHAQALII